MKIFFTVLFCFSFVFQTFSQSTFEILFKNPLTQSCSDIYESNDGSFIMVGYIGEQYQPSSYKGIIYRISESGDTLTQTYAIGDTVMRFARLFKTNDHFIVFGTSAYPPDYTFNLMVACIDKDLNLLWHKQFEFDGYTDFGNMSVKKVNDGFYVGGTLTNYPIGINGHAYFCRFNSNCDTVRTKILPELGNGQNISDFVFSADSSELWIMCYHVINARGARIVLDTLFNIKRIQDFYESIYPNMNAQWITDSTLLFAGRYNHWVTSPEDNDIGITITDTSFTNLDFHYLGAQDTLDYPAWDHIFDFNHPDTIFYAGSHNVIIDFWPHGVSWIMLGQLNSNLQSRYERYYGGDAYYRAIDLIRTRDGGCMISAIRYDYLTQDQEYDVLILKLNEQGLITDVDEGLDIPFSNALVYPNPGYNTINVRTSFEKPVFRLFDFSGKIVFSKQLHQRTSKINSSNISAGIYFFQIISNNKVIEKGKWIKRK